VCTQIVEVSKLTPIGRSRDSISFYIGNVNQRSKRELSGLLHIVGARSV